MHAPVGPPPPPPPFIRSRLDSEERESEAGMAAPPDSPKRADDQTVSAEIARSLGAVWHRFSGSRPKTMSVEVKSDVVRCVIEEGSAEESPVEDSSDDDVASEAPAGVGSPRF